MRRSQASPSLRRCELGTLLRSLRLERQLTVEQVAAELLCSPSKVSRMEAGQRGASARDVRDLCELYGVTDQAGRARLMNLAAEGKQPPEPLSVILDEAVLHRAVGGMAVMRVQLDHLVNVTKDYDVAIQVIPYSTGAHPAMESIFSILDSLDPVPSVVYVEGLAG